MIVHDDWLLTAHRAAVHLPTATAVIADLHLGYDGVRRQSGEAVPAFDMEEGLARLRLLAVEHDIRRLVIAGDVCEDGRVPGPLVEFVQELRSQSIEVVGIVPGNHDRKLREPAGAPILPDGLLLGRWRVLHGDGQPARGYVVQGHCHPCVRLAGVVAPCYLVGRQRLILPAFSADAAGVNVVGRSEWRAYRCCAIAGDKVLDFGRVDGLSRRGLKRTGGKRKRGP